MDSLSFNNLENSEFIHELENVYLGYMPMLDNINFHFDFGKDKMNNSKQINII